MAHRQGQRTCAGTCLNCPRMLYTGCRCFSNPKGALLLRSCCSLLPQMVNTAAPVTKKKAEGAKSANSQLPV